MLVICANTFTHPQASPPGPFVPDSGRQLYRVKHQLNPLLTSKGYTCFDEAWYPDSQGSEKSVDMLLSFFSVHCFSKNKGFPRLRFFTRPRFAQPWPLRQRDSVGD